MATIVLSAGNSHYVQITLTNPLTSAFINDATVTGQIDNLDDTEAVPSFSMPYIAASDGIYRATLAPDVDIINGKRYKIIIDSTGTDSLVGRWVCTELATEATGC
jgi:hypothetical protein